MSSGAHSASPTGAIVLSPSRTRLLLLLRANYRVTSRRRKRRRTKILLVHPHDAPLRGLITSCGLRLDDVQSALILRRPGPATRPWILSRTHRPRAMGAAYAGIILIVQRIVRHVVLVDVAPYLL